MKQLGLLYGLFLLGSLAGINAQNLEELGLKKGLKVNGAINWNAVVYQAKGIPMRRDPFNWFLTASLNFNLFGYHAPFSFSYSNAQSSFSQPFNQIRFNPQYKWARLYLGYNSMTFSPYTLAGHVFSGLGLELNPGKWRIGLMYGRLKKAVTYDLLDSTQYNQAAFKRMAYGLKLGYEGTQTTVMGSVFYAKDDLNSLPFVLPESQLTPKQNLALSVELKQKFLKKFSLELSYGISVLNHDLRAEKSDSSVQGSNFFQGLLPQSPTSRYFDAFKGALGYQGNRFGLQIQYERIAPEYQSLGAYYFNNDLRNITLAPTWRLFKNKLNLNANVGLQENNLDQTRAATTQRWVGNFSLAFNPNEQWNLSANYSNFSTYTNIRPQNQPFFQNSLDTLNFYQVSQATNLQVAYSLGKSPNRQTILWSGAYQTANNQASAQNTQQLSSFYTSNLAYAYTLSQAQLNIAGGLNYYASQSLALTSTYWGPNLSLSKSFAKRSWRTALTTAFNRSLTNGQNNGNVLNTRLSVNYSPSTRQSKTGKHSLSLGLNWVKKFKSALESPVYAEWTGTLAYGYHF